MREVEDETGCSCRIGNYLGTISYSDNGVPKVVLFWKMTLVEEKGSRNNEQIGEALWLPVPAAIERLTHAQEKALLSRVGSIPKQSETPVATAVSAQSHVAAACESDLSCRTSNRQELVAGNASCPLAFAAGMRSFSRGTWLSGAPQLAPR